MRFFCLLAVASISLFNCKYFKKFEFSVFSMNTVVGVTIYHNNLSNSKLERIEKKTISILKELEEKYSISKENSIVNQLKKTNQIDIDNETYSILKASEMFYHFSEKKFDITIGKLVSTWGFYNENYRFPDKIEIIRAKRFVGFDKVSFTKNKLKLYEKLWLDFGGILKGYAVEKIVDYLKSEGINSGFVNAGGNIKVFGKKPDGSEWRIGIRHPRKDGEIYKVITLLPDEAVATSGDYERFFITNGIRYHHIIDPSSGYPVNNNIASVTVITTNAMEADGYSTTLFLIGIDKGMKLARKNKIGVIFLVSDSNSIWETNNIDFKN